MPKIRFFDFFDSKFKTVTFFCACFLVLILFISLSLLARKAIAVAPTTGLVGDWDPALIVGLVDGDPAGTLPEAVAAQNATSTLTTRPIYKTTIAAFPVLLFDGTNDFLLTPAMSAVAQPYTVFMVFKPVQWRSSDRVIDGFGPNSMGLVQLDAGLALNNGSHPYSLHAGTAFAVENYGGTIIDTSSSFTLVRATFNGASSVLTTNGNTSGSGNPGASAFTGVTFGTAGGDCCGSFYSNYYLARLLVYDSNLVSAAAVEDYLAAEYSTLALSSIPNLVITDGDSLTAGVGEPDAALSYPSQLLALLGPTWTLQNKGNSGQSLVDMEFDAATDIDSQYNPDSPNNQILVGWGGTNDLFGGADAATAYSRLVTYAQNRQAAGWKVIVATLLPRSALGTPGSFEADRQTVNANIRANWETFADSLADVAADARIGDAGDEADTTYYANDLVHLKGAGYAIIASIVNGQIESLTDSTPPVVSVTAPTAGAIVSGSTVAVTADASDNVGVAGVQFKLDTSTNIGAEDTGGPYAATLDSTALSDGAHTLVAVARDALGNYATSSAITVTVDNTVPVRSAGSPSGDQAVGISQATLFLTTDEDATCKYSTVADTAYGSMTETFSTPDDVSHSATVSGLTDGQHNYYARCQDSAGNVNPDDYTISFSTSSPVAGGGGGSCVGCLNPPTTPVGGFRAFINQGAGTTSNRIVNLNFNAGADIKIMAISMTGDFTDSRQEAYQPTKQWDLCSTLGGLVVFPVCPDGTYTIHVRFYTLYGLTSVDATVSSTITLATGQPSASAASAPFTKYLRYGQTNSDVKRLQIFLNLDPDTRLADSGPGSRGSETSFFGPITRRAVIRFQEKYAQEVLAPWGLIRGTGYVGKTTLAKINLLILRTISRLF